MKFVSRIIPYIFLVIFVGCGIPLHDGHNRGFINEQDVLITDLTNDGLAAYADGRYQGAVEKFQQALSLAPNSRPIQQNLAASFVRLGMYDDAVPILTSLQTKFRNNPPLVPTIEQTLEQSQLLFMLGDTRAVLGHYGDGLVLLEAAYKKALELLLVRPAQAAAVASRLADLHFTLGHEEEARCYAEFAVQATATPEVVLHFLKILNATGNTKLVAERQSKESVNQTPETLYQLYLARRSLPEKEGKEVEERIEKLSLKDILLQEKLLNPPENRAERLWYPP